MRNSTFPALMIGGPVDGRRMFVQGVPYLEVPVMESPRCQMLASEPVSRHMRRAVYTHRETVAGVRLYVCNDENGNAALEYLVAGYRAETKH
ncbi:MULTISPECIES: hypothetical protein [Pseudomonas]|uniref:Uncharacterized protein n=1 Tax=Pseudomonas mosselii TaxID=78327 RepID=A0ABX9AVL5_9PSED|nr:MULTISPECIES: hypothetical protein [Pseudomonas]MBP2084184.1 hypothetical protein [Pseudomonas sp. PvP089]MBP2090114.1 hypothetical protein [Pseudomonas sp. PvP088]MBP2223722.1 hypothetical protein [Pseudomonas putida]MCL8298393.1 hypothetical protein [Pseudomonas mosselii]MCL8338408.1 hypothetical protein [Pseudomonas mosselii]